MPDPAEERRNSSAASQELHPFGYDPEADRLLLQGDQPVAVFLTTQDCVPCTMMKPVIKKYAIELAGRIKIVEANFDCRWLLDQYGVTAAPTLLTFRDGALLAQSVGYHGVDETRKTIFAAAGIDLARTEADIAFDARAAQAEAAMDAIMEGPSAALAPHMETIQAGQTVVEREIKSRLESGELSPDEKREAWAAALSRLYEPFQDKVDALRAAQVRAVEAYEAVMTDAVREYAGASATSSTAARPSLTPAACRVDGSGCT